MSFPRSRVQAILKSSKVSVGHVSEVSFLRIHTTDETIEIFIRAPFLRTIRVSEIAGHVELPLNFEIAEILGAAVARERLAKFIRQHRQSLDHDTVRFCNAPIFHLAQEYNTGHPFVDTLQAVGALSRHHRIVFPVANLFSLVDGSRPIFNRGQRHVVQFLCRSEALFLPSLVPTGEIHAQSLMTNSYLSRTVIHQT